MPSTHRRSCANETICVVAGCLTWIWSRVPDAIGSTQPSFFNRLKPTIAASYKLSADTSTLWPTPDGPVKLTVHVFVAIAHDDIKVRYIFAIIGLAQLVCGPLS